MYKYRRIIVCVIAALLALVLVLGIVVPALAASSAEIQERINELEQQKAAIEAQQRELSQQIAGNEGEIMDLVQRKSLIDQQIKLTQDSIEVLTLEIQETNLLIAQLQNDLDDALAERDRLTELFAARICSMEENGNITYWSILFKASSFSDMLDRVDMINEIAENDAMMLQQIEDNALRIETTRQELTAQKVSLEEQKDELAQQQEQLENQRAEADEIMAELMADHDALMATSNKYDAQKEDLLVEIAQQESAYQVAVAEEEEARRRAAEEEARRKREQEEREAAARQNGSMTNPGSGSSSGGSSGGGGSSSYGFIWPSACHTVSCEFGPRYHPITGVYSNHSGMDIAASYGTPIYACASGTVTTATFSTAYGYYVVINHGNGFSTLYGHMCQYSVSPGDYVTQGQIIGYVGNTGWSTGPHLHLTMYYNGSLVNPRAYLP